jgi:hypothetical protein
MLTGDNEQLQPGNNFTLAAVPEVVTLSISVIGAVGIGLLIRRRPTRGMRKSCQS